MTMQHPTHPDDERLAALAGGDPEVTADGALRAHVDSCERCAEAVRELGSLRAALAEHERARLQRGHLERLEKESGTTVVTLPYLFEPELGLDEYQLLADELAESL